MANMNNSIIKHILLGGIITTLLTSCTGNYLDYNTNPYEVTKDEMGRDGYNLSAALIGMESYVVPVEEHLNQFTECLLGGPWGGYFADSQVWGNSFSYYNPSQEWLGKLYLDVMPNIYANMQDVKSATEDVIPISIAQIIKVAALSRVTDTYGPIPYSQVGLDGKLVAPFDTEKEVYYKMFDELTDAINTLTINRTQNLTANADKVYSGNVEKWIKFANSLKLRMAMRICYVDKGKSEIMVKEAIDTSNGKLGVMTENSDNAFMPATINPFYMVCYSYNGGETKISADLSSYMNGYQDPRREIYGVTSTFDESENITNGFHGLRVGNEYPIKTGQCYSNVKVEVSSPIMWMNAAEVMFLRAEAALRGWDTEKTPKAYYEAGIRLSFEQLGAKNVEDYLVSTNTPESYKDPLGTYSFSGTPSTISVQWKDGNFEESLERIITQKWIANFPLGLEAWAEFRRTGYPKLMGTASNKSGGDIEEGKFPRRLTYPQDEYKTNSENIRKAVTSLGGDYMHSRIWWDCNPRIEQ